MPNYQSPLGRLIPNKPDAEVIKREGWRDHRILVVGLDDPRLSGFQRELIQLLGNKLYGETDHS